MAKKPVRGIDRTVKFDRRKDEDNDGENRVSEPEEPNREEPNGEEQPTEPSGEPEPARPGDREQAEREYLAGFSVEDPGTSAPSSSSGKRRKLTKAERRKAASARSKAFWERKRAAGATVGNGGSSSLGGTTKAETQANLAGLETLLLSVHAAIAAVSHIPEMRLDANEARVLAKATADVMAHYPLAFSPKQVAWCNLVMTASGIYGTRAIAYSARMRAERDAAKRKLGPSVVEERASSRPEPTSAPNGGVYIHTSVPPVD
jgi:hypothetical protein